MAVTTKGGGPVVGLDIGSAYIKAVEMKPAKGGLAITGIGITPTPPGTVADDEIVDPETLAAAVKQCLAEAGIKTKTTVSSVSGQNSVIVRVIDVPRMNEKELAETMRWEISRHVPFAPDEIVQDYSPVVRPGDDPTSPNMSVLLAVAQNGVVNGQLETVLRAGLKPRAIDVESLSSARALLDLDGAADDDVVAIVNIGASKTDLGIFERGALAFPRVIPVAGNALSDAVARSLNVEYDDAERLKKEFGEVPPDASERFGSQAAAASEFTFGDFGGAGGFISEGDAAIFGAQGAAGVVSPGVPIEGPSLDVPAIGGPLGDVAIPEAPTFSDIPAIGDPTLGAAAFAPTFEAPEFPAEPAGFDVQPEAVETPPPAAETMEEAPPPDTGSRADVMTEAERHRRQISDAFMPVLAEIVTEIGRSMEYYVTRANGSPVKRIVVCGGTSRMPGLTRFMEKELNVPVSIAGIPPGITASPAGVTPEYVADVASLLPVAEGLATYSFVVPDTAPMPSKGGKGK
jgi:type IV pilus assembly protein PilM